MELIDLTLPIEVEILEQDTLEAPFRPKRSLSTRTWTLQSATTETQLLPHGATGAATLPCGATGVRTLPQDAAGTRTPSHGATEYHARVHDFTHWSMAGTYLDLPGHIVETDDAMDAARLPVDRLYRLDATVVRLDRASGSGKIGAAELAAAAPVSLRGKALIVHALGRRRFDEIEERSVYLGSDAVQWIIDTGIGLLVADVYESNTDPQGVFPMLFRHGILAVCYAVDLHRLRDPHVTLTVLPLRFCGATQLPCRVVAEQEDRP
jgi:kynurenine formamidase